MLCRPLAFAIVGFGLVPTSAGSQAFRSGSTAAPQVVDSLEVAKRVRNLQVAFERKRRFMLPKYYPGTADRCLIVGRFCEWHPNLEDSKVPDEGDDIRRARNEFLRELEKAAALVPGDDWVVGQRVRYLVEGHDPNAVGVARSCRATRWWCDALVGLALHTSGNFVGADSAYASALAGMPPERKCHWLNLAPLLDDDIRKPYKKLSCAEREAADARIWWVSDPLFMVPGNERRTEHFSRVVQTELQTNAANAYGMSWSGDIAELILRFGWAEKWTQEPAPTLYSGGPPRITGHEREPGFHFFLTQPPPEQTEQILDSLFELHQDPPREQYAPVYAKRKFLKLDAQVARFRRGDSTLVVAAYDVTSDTILGRRAITAGLAASAGDSQLRLVSKDNAPPKNVITMMSPFRTQLVGVELLAADSSAAARWRSGLGEIPLDSARISVSDILFVDGAPSLPSDLTEAIPRTHGGTKFRRDRKIGLFWELYGRAPTDSLPISLTLTPIEDGFFKRAFRVLRIAAKQTPLNIRWQDNGAAGVLSARAVMLDLSLVPEGKYSVKLEVGNDPGAVSSRVIEVSDKLKE